MSAQMLRDLDQLKRDLLTMGAHVEESIRKAIIALVDRRPELAKEVKAADKEIDALENAIDEACYRILALHQPVADDLRFVLTVIKVNNELERMGDHAKSIGKSAKLLAKADPLPIYDDLNAASEATIAMVSKGLDALIKRDVGIAEQVREMDDKVDDACDAAFQHVTRIITEKPDLTLYGITAISACRHLERIGDLATNIAKDVIFLVEGDNVRHGGRVPEAQE